MFTDNIVLDGMFSVAADRGHVKLFMYGERGRSTRVKIISLYVVMWQNSFEDM